MQRLTKSLRLTLAALAPYDADPAFGKALSEGASLVSGITPYRLLADIRDLQDAGMLKIIPVGRKIDCIVLTAAGRDYFRNSKWEVAKTVASYAFQLLVGASGGLAALFASQLLFQ